MIKFFTSKNIHGSKFSTFYCCLIAIYCFETALKNLSKIDVKRGHRFTPSSKDFTKILKF